jgi:hypothetical protein
MRGCHPIGLWLNHRYQKVWLETLDTYHDMVSAEGWNDKDVIEVPVFQKLIFKVPLFLSVQSSSCLTNIMQFALLIIAKCGFGFTFDWDSPPTAADGGASIQETLRIVADHTMSLVFLPKWLRYLPLKK